MRVSARKATGRQVPSRSACLLPTPRGAKPAVRWAAPAHPAGRSTGRSARGAGLSVLPAARRNFTVAVLLPSFPWPICRRVMPYPLRGRWAAMPVESMVPVAGPLTFCRRRSAQVSALFRGCPPAVAAR